MSKDKEKNSDKETIEDKPNLEELLKKLKNKTSEKDSEDKNENSEDKKESKEKIIETKKDNSKISEQEIKSRLSESETENFFKNLSQNSSISTIPRNSFSFQPQRTLESGLSETPSQNLSSNQQNSDNENPFEYIPKQEQDSSQKVYRSYENSPNIKMQKPEEASKNWSQNFRRIEGEFRSSESAKINNQQKMYENYVKPPKVNELEKDKKEKDFQFREAKTEYYSHK
jgi:hypothetical protein